jgi:YD repeat-containing protein
MMRRYVYRISLFLFVLLNFSNLRTEAQTTMQTFYQNPDLLPKSPDVSNLFRFSEIPVDQSSGTANINIPIYTIQQGKIEIPITLNYNTSGVKVREVASMVGLGWGLSFGGSISVSEQDYSGHYDFRQSPVKTGAQASNSFMQMHTHLWLMANGYAQTQQPMYNFSFNGYQGKFFYDINNQLHIAPQYLGIQVERIPTNMSLKPTGFKITTAEGILYEFTSAEMGFTESSLAKPTGFYITKILDLNNTFDQVDFTYSIKPRITYYTRSTHLFKTFEENHYNPPLVTIYNSNVVSTVKNQYSDELSIQSIVFKKGKIVFTTLDDRLDQGKRRIQKIELQSETNLKLKEWALNQSYFIGNGSASQYNYRLRLDDITVTGGTNTEKHIFEYDPTPLPPTNSLAEDYWGFYNGATSNTGQISGDIATYYGITLGWQDYAERKANPTFTKSGILKKITYPTGGSMALTYENHIFPGFVLGTYVGGLRVKNINYSDPVTGSTVQKNYVYNSPNLMTDLTYNKFYYEKKKMAAAYSGASGQWTLSEYNTKNINSDPLAGIAYHNGSPVFYNEVEEFYTSPNEQNGKTIYKFNYVPPLYVFAPVKEYGYQYLIDNDWERGQLNSVEYYSYSNSTSTYNLIKKEACYYENAVVESIPIGLHVIKNDNKCGTPAGPSCGSADDVVEDYQTQWDDWYQWNNTQRYVYFDAYTYIGRKKMIKKEEWNYGSAGSIVTTTNYNYMLHNNHYLYVKSVSSNTSKGDLSSTEFKYPFDFSSSSTENAAMVVKNMISVPIEQKTFLNNTLKTTSKKNYGFWNNNTLIEISNIQSSTNANPLEIVSTINSYSPSGRPLELTGKNGIKKMYVLGYNDNYYTAEAINVSSLSDIAYTSFEGTYQTLQGNWQLTGTAPISDPTSPTGTTCYWIGQSNYLMKSGLSPSINYTVSYWSKNGPYNVVGSISTITGKTLNGWTLYKHTVTNVSSTSIQSAQLGYIDEVRLYPAKAFLNTFAYASLGDISSKCDANDVISRFEYDALGRLILIRDQDNNILKKICYNYAGQQETCPTSCINTLASWQNTSTALRCQQGTCGNTGYQEQEQKDMNPCSSTYNQTQWVSSGYNPSTCSASTCTTLSSNNMVGLGNYIASYYNTVTAVTYNFNISSSSGILTLGNIPIGTYNLTIYRASGLTPTLTFSSGCSFQSIEGSSATFYNINITATRCKTVKIENPY